MTWIVHASASGRLGSYPDELTQENIDLIRESHREGGEWEVLLDIDNVALVWKWRVDNEVIVYAREP